MICRVCGKDKNEREFHMRISRFSERLALQFPEPCRGTISAVDLSSILTLFAFPKILHGQIAVALRASLSAFCNEYRPTFSCFKNAISAFFTPSVFGVAHVKLSFIFVLSTNSANHSISYDLQYNTSPTYHPNHPKTSPVLPYGSRSNTVACCCLICLKITALTHS